jgi:hypothetical protein
VELAAKRTRSEVTSAVGRAAALALCALTACSDPQPEMPDAAPPAPAGELVLGGSDVGGLGFVAIADGDEVELVAGAQGGFHIWTTLRATGVAGPVYLQREARRVDDGTLILRAQQLYLEVPLEAMEVWWQRDEASPSFMCPTPIGVKVFDVEITLSAQLTDEDGAVLAEDEITVTPRCPDGDQHEFCLRICAG